MKSFRVIESFHAIGLEWRAGEMDTSDRRLELVRSVRQEQERNNAAMRQWESAFYGGNEAYTPGLSDRKSVV